MRLLYIRGPVAGCELLRRGIARRRLRFRFLRPLEDSVEAVGDGKAGAGVEMMEPDTLAGADV